MKTNGRPHKLSFEDSFNYHPRLKRLAKALDTDVSKLIREAVGDLLRRYPSEDVARLRRDSLRAMKGR